MQEGEGDGGRTFELQEETYSYALLPSFLCLSKNPAWIQRLNQGMFSGVATKLPPPYPSPSRGVRTVCGRIEQKRRKKCSI
jgi:hypothetical protein